MFNSYVKLPEGKSLTLWGSSNLKPSGRRHITLIGGPMIPESSLIKRPMDTGQPLDKLLMTIALKEKLFIDYKSAIVFFPKEKCWEVTSNEKVATI